MKRVAVAGIFACSVVLHASCDDAKSLSVDEYADACHAVACARAIECGSVANRAECDLPNVVDCELDARFVDAVRDGRIAWDGEAAAACIVMRAAIGCDWTGEAYRTSYCDISRGLLDDGETCVLSSECISNECFNEFCTEACCAGSCAGSVAPTPGLIGEQCRTTHCAEGYCDGSYCVPFVDEGGACDRVGACEYGLACSNRLCRALPDRDEPCEPVPFLAGECRQIGDRCSSVTRRCEDRNFAGTPCSANDDCAPLYKCENQQCVFSRAELGEDCDYDHECATPGSVCSFDFQCILPRAAGEPCSHYSECASNICHYDVGTCGSLEGCL